uniref:Lipase_GDSL domain-containing protein n=1 Tax=Plectus sambesii TaxID=2011161 RepID=A0A914VW42_9BILA
MGKSEEALSKEASESMEKNTGEEKPKEIIVDTEETEAAALFENHKAFACANSKIEFVTGTSAYDIYPGDIGIIAALGDSCSTGYGLWDSLPHEYRGATFSHGGDATLDDLITMPNILKEFNSNLTGASHGMGTSSELPAYQLNIAKTGAKTADLPAQAEELVNRLLHSQANDFKEQWVMVVITIGSEEMCTTCQTPNIDDIKSTLDFLRENIPKAFVVIVGPVNYWSHFLKMTSNLRGRCPCFKKLTEAQIESLNKEWRKVCADLEQEYNTESSTFGVVAVPVISMPSDTSTDLLLSKSVHLSLKGHKYATKFLWNRLMTGRSYNVSSSPYKDALLCPYLDCPYFRTTLNGRNCQTVKYSEVTTTLPPETTTRSGRRRQTKMSLYITAGAVVALSFCTVLIVGTVLYRMMHHEDSRMGA